MTNPPNELKGDRRRQAVASIAGSVYQAWCSIDAWLRLADAGQVIFLEGAEDFDLVGGEGGDVAVQIKRNVGSISLGNAKAHEALENFWALIEREPEREVYMHYLTTSSTAMELDANFGGIRGLDAWRAARTSPELASAVAHYVALKLSPASGLRQFLLSASPEDLKKKIFLRFHWFTGQPDIDAVKRSVEDRISVLLSNQHLTTSLTSKVRVQLESRFWEVITENSSSLRCLTFGDLLRQVEHATTTYLPLPVDKLPEILGGVSPGLGLLKLLIQKTPRPPAPLISRPELTRQISMAVSERRAVLLTGTVYKGKTTIAQQVAQSLCPEAWWVNLTERRPDQIDNVLLALAGEIDRGMGPGLVVIDDLDISPQAHRVYRDSLALVLHRARESGSGIVVTAQGASSESAQISAIERLDVVDVPELSQEEVKSLCIQEGCSDEYADFWSLAIQTHTRGHPKLVQVRLIELSERGWPRPIASDLVSPSPAAQTARQISRRLLSQSVAPEVAEC
uniref:hypothetical protein n=1 Tax=Hylemonella sp. TaxID=2066020 RepID=UPI0035AED875